MKATQNLCSFVTRAKWGREILIKTRTQLKGHVTLLINHFQEIYGLPQSFYGWQIKTTLDKGLRKVRTAEL